MMIEKKRLINSYNHFNFNLQDKSVINLRRFDLKNQSNLI